MELDSAMLEYLHHNSKSSSSSRNYAKCPFDDDQEHYHQQQQQQQQPTQHDELEREYTYNMILHFVTRDSLMLRRRRSLPTYVSTIERLMNNFSN